MADVELQLCSKSPGASSSRALNHTGHRARLFGSPWLQSHAPAQPRAETANPPPLRRSRRLGNQVLPLLCTLRLSADGLSLAFCVELNSCQRPRLCVTGFV